MEGEKLLGAGTRWWITVVLGFTKYAEDQGLAVPHFLDPSWQDLLMRATEDLKKYFPGDVRVSFHRIFDEERDRSFIVVDDFDAILTGVLRRTKITMTWRMVIDPVEDPRYFYLATSSPGLMMDLFAIASRMEHFFEPTFVSAA